MGQSKSAQDGIRPVATILLVAFLAIGVAAAAIALVLLGAGKDDSEKRAAPAEKKPIPSAVSTATPRIVPVFTDVTAEAGICFRHEAGCTGRFYYLEVMGAGCAFFDADNDGNLDVYLVNGNHLPPHSPSSDTTDALYRNNGDGSFTDVTSQAGLADASYGQGCCAADYDGDGDQDLYVTNFGPNRLYRNQGDGTFALVEQAAADPGWGQSCAFFDADRDGDLDLYVENYLIYALEDQQDWYVMVGGKKVRDYCGPDSFDGQQDRLYRNLGAGTLEDMTQEAGIIAPDGTGMGLVCADLDNDGDQDIVVANDNQANFYFQNDRAGHFTESALVQGLAYNSEGRAEAFMGIDAGDFNGDGLLDLAIPCLRTQGFSLFQNLGTMFSDVSVVTGLDKATSPVEGFAPVFIDYDSDGDLDLYFTTGGTVMGNAGAATSFRDGYAMRDLLLENRQNRYVDVTTAAGPALDRLAVSRACAAGDYDNDGDLDLLITAVNDQTRLLRNDTDGGHWIGFTLRGRVPNRDAIGARLRLTAGGRARVSEIVAGGSYLGQRDRRVLFGLGQLTQVEELLVRWPDGKEMVHHNLPVDRYHELYEPER